jgi:hypothetical protein
VRQQRRQSNKERSAGHAYSKNKLRNVSIVYSCGAFVHAMLDYVLLLLSPLLQLLLLHKLLLPLLTLLLMLHCALRQTVLLSYTSTVHGRTNAALAAYCYIVHAISCIKYATVMSRYSDDM